MIVLVYWNMEKRGKNKTARPYALLTRRLIIIIFLLVIHLLFRLLRNNRAVMNFMTDRVAHPVRGFIAWACSVSRWSFAEWVVVFAALFAAVLIICFIAALIKNPGRALMTVLRFLSLTAVLVLVISALMILLWNVNYYADNFSDKSGILPKESTADELYETTRYIAGLLAESSLKIARDQDGFYAESTEAAFDLSATVFRGIQQQYPFLSGRELRSKKVLFSRFLSEIRTTGVAFPLTGEANINIDQPAAWIPSTIAHEIAHQRKIASEQEANFVAILACEMSGNDAYRYSGYLFAYDYLAGALANADYRRFREISDTLPEEVLLDLRLNYEYWLNFENKISEVSDSLYDDYLKTQGQDLGSKSYGAVVDLLIAYYSQ